MAEKTVIVKGGFRANLALLISIIALIVSIIAFQRIGGQADLEARIKNLNEKLKTVKQESSDRMSKVLQETKKGLEKLSIEIEKRGRKQEEQKSEE